MTKIILNMIRKLRESKRPEKNMRAGFSVLFLTSRSVPSKNNSVMTMSGLISMVLSNVMGNAVNRSTVRSAVWVRLVIIFVKENRHQSVPRYTRNMAIRPRIAMVGDWGMIKRGESSPG